MMFHMRNKHNRAFHRWQREKALQLLGHFEAQNALKFVDHGCHARARRDDHIVWPGVDVALDQVVRQMIGVSHRAASDVGF